MHKNVEHIFFDLDHTLWNFDANSQETFNELWIEFQLEGIFHRKTTLEEFYSTYMELNEKMWAKYRIGDISQSELRNTRFKKLLNSFSIENDNLAQNLNEYYMHHCPRKNGLIIGCLEVLEHLYDKYQLHIITNGFNETQQIKMKSSGLLQYFKHIITSENAGCKKPDVKIFNFALELTSARENNSVMIGDDFNVDGKGAQNAGIKSFILKSDNVKDDFYDDSKVPIKILMDLKELKSIF